MTKRPMKTAPLPSVAEAAAIAESNARVAQRTRPVTAKIESANGTVRELGPPNADLQGWGHRMCDAFGTASPDFVNAQLAYIINAIRPQSGDVPANAFNACLAAVSGGSPQNEIEAMLLGQMVAVNHAAQEMVGRMMRTDRVDHMTEYGSLATKLQRTFVAQVEALAKLQRGGEQVVRVVHVHEGGQAVIGDVHTGGPPSQIRGQSHATLIPELPAMSRPNATRNPVPVGGDEKRSMPHARRNKPRRAKGKS